jgi:protein-disulfide isomerase
MMEGDLMLSIPRICVAIAACVVLLPLSTRLETTGNHASPNIASASRYRSDAYDRAIVLVDDWEELPSGSNSGAPSDSHAAGVSGDDSAAVGGHPQRGPDSAPVTIVEYSDFQCPYCRQAEPIVKQVRKVYGRNVRVVYMDFPLGFHPEAMGAAIAARCADEQGQFWAYHDALLAGASGLSIPALKNQAASLGLDAASFDRCLDERKYAGAIESDMAEGRRSGVSGTPTFIVDGKPVVGAVGLSEFEKMVDAGLGGRARSDFNN